uniref:Protein kinase and helix-hairpin-helix DNA-binding domain-containing protein n=1 Tax=Candidatus Kentrum sp. DK TaxID=2126562 RepID=A0A450SFC1_9GAMM|nr:MAG: protein kinase and helix-hairpin-helix DNA-binding domain-containing protein [Candidatus Kentron sp. DK]
MGNAFFTGKGASIQLGPEIGRGGEGSVHELIAKPNQAAKIYSQNHLPDAGKQAKLRAMASMVDERLLTYAAWPQETIHKGRNGPVIGFLMPKVTGRAPIHMLYSPAHRRQEYPSAAWDFLLFVARNMAAAFEEIHGHGHVLGDVNQGNVLVGKDSKVVLIDCDSYQISAHGNTHLCKVGVSHFTPPELQGLSSFDNTKRTENHDNFGLALLIFHLLFGGRHPYSGVPLRKDAGEALETDIKLFRFAYARDAQSRSMRSPPNSIPLSLVPETVAKMFEIAFTESGSTGKRPSAQEWVTTLEALRSGIRKCNATAMHIYPNHLTRCPWCDLENQGAVYFISIGSGFVAGVDGFNLAKVWAAINAVKAPPSVRIPDIASFQVAPTPLPKAISRIKRLILLLRFLVISVSIGWLSVKPELWFFTGLIAWFAWTMVNSIGEAKRDEEGSKRRRALEKVREEYNALKSRVRSECGPEAFNAKKQELIRLRDEYQGLPTMEKKEIERLHSTARERQKKRYLARHFIDSARIPGIGPAKKAVLRSFGIETAADVSSKKVRAVRGFGEVLTRSVVDWKKSLERRFVFDPRNAVREADKNAVRAKISSRRCTIEASLSSGSTELMPLWAQANSKTSILLPQFKLAGERMAQAQVDLDLLLR